MHPGPGQLHMMRGFTSDSSVTKQQLKRGTVRRIAGYARPYRRQLAIFLLAAALDAVITVTIPVLLGVVIDRGVLPKRAGVVLVVAAAVAGLAILDALLNLAQRWYTARVGEGLIYDLRTQVFGRSSPGRSPTQARGYGCTLRGCVPPRCATRSVRCSAVLPTGMPPAGCGTRSRRPGEPRPPRITWKSSHNRIT
jgi:hypothetical protein